MPLPFLADPPPYFPMLRFTSALPLSSPSHPGRFSSALGPRAKGPPLEGSPFLIVFPLLPVGSQFRQPHPLPHFEG